jgi:hypothetical protein
MPDDGESYYWDEDYWDEDTTWPEGFRRLNERLCVWRSRRCEPKL